MFSFISFLTHFYRTKNVKNARYSYVKEICYHTDDKYNLLDLNIQSLDGFLWYSNLEYYVVSVQV